MKNTSYVRLGVVYAFKKKIIIILINCGNWQLQIDSISDFQIIIPMQQDALY